MPVNHGTVQCTVHKQAGHILISHAILQYWASTLHMHHKLKAPQALWSLQPQPALGASRLQDKSTWMFASSYNCKKAHDEARKVQSMETLVIVTPMQVI